MMLGKLNGLRGAIVTVGAVPSPARSLSLSLSLSFKLPSGRQLIKATHTHRVSTTITIFPKYTIDSLDRLRLIKSTFSLV